MSRSDRLAGASLLFAAAALFAAGCGDMGEPIMPEDLPRQASPSTWQTIQTRILDRQCVDCHRAGTSFADQSGLQLTAGVSYRQLVGVPPTNGAARDAGLLRVGTEGLPSLGRSFLWEKINAPAQEHFYADHPEYGLLMPLGRPPLTNGQLAFIEAWILAGAPREGTVADPALLADESRYQPPEFRPLPLPVNGRQVHIGPFPVLAGREREFQYYAPLESPGAYIKRIEAILSPGSHHMTLNVFRPDTPTYLMPEPYVYRDVWGEDGTYLGDAVWGHGYLQFVTGVQSAGLDYRFPPGVAFPIPPDGGIDIGAHFVNRTAQPQTGELYVNVHFVEPVEVQHVARTLYLRDLEFVLPPHERTTVVREFLFPERRNVFQLVAHAHERMTEFRVERFGPGRPGELVYVANDWEHPPVMRYDPPLHMEEGEGLRLIVTYDNQTDREIRDGLLSTDEMLILYGFYYTD